MAICLENRARYCTKLRRFIKQIKRLNDMRARAAPLFILLLFSFFDFLFPRFSFGSDVPVTRLGDRS